MKKYKLIKIYPNSPDLETILHEGESGYTWDNEGPYCRYFYTNKSEIENYPEFWQKVKEFPKIVAFREIKSNSNDVGNIAELQPDNSFKLKKGVTDILLKEKELLKGTISVEDGYFEIYQVQVESGEIFTIGDKVQYVNGKNKELWENCSITNFEHNDGIPYARVKSVNGIDSHSTENLEKVKEPIFVTEDGKEVYEGDKFWFLWNSDNNIWFGSCEPINTYGYTKNPKHILFHSHAAAEKYIDENKPRFSKKQIEEAMQIKGISTHDQWLIDCREFKQKLGI